MWGTACPYMMYRIDHSWQAKSQKPPPIAGSLALVGVLIALLGCGSPPPPSGGSASPTVSVLSSQQLADAIRFRSSVGLRADQGWILAVAADPASRPGKIAYGTPLTPAEKAELDARAANATELSGEIERYGAAHPAEWAGAFIDRQSGVFVALFTGALGEHESAIRQLVLPGARFEVRPARWSLAVLESRRREIEDDQEWLRTINAWYAGSGVDIVSNRLVLDISSKNPMAPALALRHYAGDGWLVVESDGIGRWEGPLGTAVIRAVTRAGEPALWLDCVLIPDDPAAWLTEAYGTGDRGTCRVPNIGATGYIVELKRLTATSEWEVIGRGRVVVPPGGEGFATIEVDLP